MKNRPLDRTATATGISKTTIKRIYQMMTEDKEILTPTTATETARRELLSTFQDDDRLFGECFTITLKPLHL